MIPVASDPILGWYATDDAPDGIGTAELLGLRQVRTFAEEEVSLNCNGKAAVLEFHAVSKPERRQRPISMRRRWDD